MKLCVCDIGGTNFRMGIFENGVVSEVTVLPTPNYLQLPSEDIYRELLRRIVQGFRALRQVHGEICTLSLCFPGPVDADGRILGSSVIFGRELDERIPLKQELCALLPGIRILVMNDITAAAYRYIGRYERFCLVTVSSGIGNKVCIDGRILLDSQGRCGEIGHFPVPLEGYSVPCSCGTGLNHVGMIASGRGVALFGNLLWESEAYRTLYENSLLHRSDGRELSTEEIASAADRGDLYAVAVIDFCSRPLAYVLSALAVAMDLPHFILIGGLAVNCRYYREALIANMVRVGLYNFSEADIRGMIVPGEKDDYHGLLGCGIAAERPGR